MRRPRTAPRAALLVATPARARCCTARAAGDGCLLPCCAIMDLLKGAVVQICASGAAGGRRQTAAAAAAAATAAVEATAQQALSAHACMITLTDLFAEVLSPRACLLTPAAPSCGASEAAAALPQDREGGKGGMMSLNDAATRFRLLPAPAATPQHSGCALAGE